MPSLTALTGTATAAFSAAVLVAPAALLRPSGLDDDRSTRALVRMVCARDVVLGVALATAPAGPLRRRAVAGRVASDLTDAAALAVGLAGQRRRGLVSASAAVWGLVCLTAGVLDERAGR
ncbi:hypothetical protein [Modestobacter sp. SSW1-42]|uniref:hypothetical protein n=1 Tax=Modestobacter sp. SSW1-42 TaxID=596372 RepID=UPI0039860131